MAEMREMLGGGDLGLLADMLPPGLLGGFGGGFGGAFGGRGMGGGFDGFASDTFETGRPGRRTAPPPASTGPEIEMGCICGYSCGTRAALDKHLARFPGDPAHAAQIKEV